MFDNAYRQWLAFGVANDVNPPVLAWATLVVYRHDRNQRGQGDYEFLAEMFHSLMLNYSWWINRKDAAGRDIIGGGFLGMDNIGRVRPGPTVARRRDA